MALKKPSDLFGVRKVSQIVEEIDRLETTEDIHNSNDNSSSGDLSVSLSASVIDEIFDKFQERIEKTYISKIENTHENDVRSVYEELAKCKKLINTTELRVEGRVSTLKKELCERIDERITHAQQTIKELYRSEITQIKKLSNDIRLVEEYIARNSNKIIDLKNQINEELQKRPVSIDKIEDKINLVAESYQNLSENLDEGLLNEPTTKDPVDNTQFVTSDQLKDHYRLFLNRIQEQLSTFGGGGEVRLQYLDDVVGIATNAAAYDGKFLKYNHSLKKFEFVTVSSGGEYSNSNVDTHLNTSTASTGEVLSWNGSDYDWVTQSDVWTEGSGSDIYYNGGGYVGIGTTNPLSALDVYGDFIAEGELHAFFGDLVTDDIFPNNVDVWYNLNVNGISTLGNVEVSSGIVTATTLSGVVTYYGDGSNLTGVSTFSGNYNDLSNTPTIPSDTGDLTNNVGFITSGSLSGLASEAFVGLATAGLASEAFVGLATAGLASEAFVGLATAGLTTEAKTNSLQAQINSLGNNLNIIGFYDAAVGVVTSLTVIGETRGYISVGNTLPSVGITTGDYLIVSTSGGNVGVASYISLGISSVFPGDWIVGVGNSEWNILSYSQQVVAPRATNADFADTLKSDSSVNTSGIITAGSFYGSGANLTGLTGASIGTYGDATNSAQITVDANGRITSIAQTAIVGAGSTTSEWTLGANGTSDYTFTGPGLTGAENDPTLYLVRGQTYRFKNTMGAHPFRIQSTVNGSVGTQYNDGITNNDVSNGTLIWKVQFDAPKVLYYQCTSHPSMGGAIFIIGENEVSPSYTDLSVSGILTVNQGRIQADAASNLRFGNIAAGSGSDRNIAIGDQVLGSLSGGSGRNIGIGELSLNNTGTGAYNIGVGIKAGQLISGGSYNVVLGGYDGNSGNLDIRTLSNRVVIADGEGNIRQYIDSSGKVGINTTVLTETLTVAGVVSATSFYGTVPSSQLSGALPAIDGSALINVTGTGSGVVIKNNASPVGTAATIDFGSGLNVSFASGIATVTGINTANINANTLNVTGISTFAGITTVTGPTLFSKQLSVSGISSIGGNIIVGHNPNTQGSGSIISDGAINLTGPNSTDSNSTIYQNIRLNRVGNSFRYDLEFHSNGYSSGDIGDFIFYKRIAQLGGGRAERMRLTGEDGNLTVNGSVTAASFSGSGAGLTSIPSSQLTGNLPAIDGSALLNVNATGDGVVVENNGTNVGSAKTINFDTGVDVTYSSGIATVTVTASGGSLQSRTTVSASTASIADNAVGLVTVTGFKSYALMKVGLSTAGWIRIYTDGASRTADASRSVGEDPLPGSGVIAEVVTTGISTEQKISPFTMGGNMDDPVDTTIYMSITNLSGTTQSINANLTILQLEA